MLRCPETGGALDLAQRELDGRYRFKRCIGQSASSWVWQAKHLKTRRKVAIKLLLPERGEDSRLRARLEQEGQLAGRIHSDYVVSVFDQGQCSLGPYVVMDWIDGETLQERLEQEDAGPWPSRRIHSVASSLAQAMMDMHRAGVVHRDLKPGNIMLRGQGARVQLKVLDFGMAKGLLSPGDAVRGPAGTLAYMAPEQSVDPDQVDERADIYSFGVILEQLLHGVAFPKARGGKDTKVQAGWLALVQDCTAKDPQQRLGSAKALAQRLSKLSGSKVRRKARPRASGGRAWLPLAVGMGAGLGVAAGVGYLPSGPQTLCEPAIRAESPELWLDRTAESPRCLALSAGLSPSPAAALERKGHPSKRGLRGSTRSPRAKPPEADELFQPHAPTSLKPAPVPALDERAPSKAVATPKKSPSPGGAVKPLGNLWVLRQRSSAMGFFDARQYCESLAQQKYQGLDTWRLATAQEIGQWPQVKEVRAGWYWANELQGGRAKVVRLPSRKHFFARVRRRFVRPYCVATRRL